MSPPEDFNFQVIFQLVVTRRNTAVYNRVLNFDQFSRQRYNHYPLICVGVYNRDYSGWQGDFNDQEPWKPSEACSTAVAAKVAHCLCVPYPRTRGNVRVMHAEREKSNALGEMATYFETDVHRRAMHKITRALKESQELKREWYKREMKEREMQITLEKEEREMKKRIHVQQAIEYCEAKLSEKKINLGHDICYERIPDTRASLLPERHSEKTLFKVKRGLRGFVNGARVSALADTGCSGNSVSLAFAQEMKLALHGSPTKFVLGNSTSIKSLGRLTPLACSDIHTALMLPQVP